MFGWKFPLDLGTTNDMHKYTKSRRPGGMLPPSGLDTIGAQ